MQVKDHDDGQAGLEAGTLDACCSDRSIPIGLALKAQNPGRLALMEEFLSYDRGFGPRPPLPHRRDRRDLPFGDNPPSGLLRAVYILNAYPE